MNKKIVSILLVLSFVFTTPFTFNTVNAKTDKEKLNDVESKIDSKKNNLNNEKNTSDNLSGEIKDVDSKISELSNTISAQEKKQSTLEKDLIRTKEELKDAKEKRKKYQDALKERMETMYMYGNMGYLDLIFSSTDFSDLISKIITVQSLVSYDRNIISKLQDTENDIKTKTTKISSSKKELDTTIKSLAKNKDDLNTLKIAKNSELKNVNGTIDDLKKQIASLEKEKSDLDSKIAAQSAASTNVNYNNGNDSSKNKDNKDKDKGNGNSGGNTGGSSSGGGSSSSSKDGVLSWPVPGHYNITSYFGHRDQPTAGASTNHGAVDIGVSTGTPVRAPANGKVTYSGWNGGYGYAVSIDCGNINGDHITVLLAHNSSLKVSTGQKVKRGQIVSYSGSTGISTGPHLHFAVYKNGYAVDPLNYVNI